jgi:hypothetical protein
MPISHSLARSLGDKVRSMDALGVPVVPAVATSSCPFLARTAAIVALAGSLACSPAPRVRNVEMGDVHTGEGSLDAARAALKGTWSLDSYDLYSASGAATPVEAQAHLTYDDFGNITMVGQSKQPPGAPTAVVMLNYKGRAVIDNTKKQIRFVDLEGSGDLTRANPDAVREYAIDGNHLVMTQKDAAGKTVSIAKWTRVSTP